MKKTLVKNWFTIVLSTIGIISPILLNNISNEVLPPIEPSHHLARTFGPSSLVQLPAKPRTMLASAREYTYTFSGQAMSKGLPCPNTQVEIRVTSEYGADIHKVTTDEEGNYSLAVPVTGKPNETLSWEIRALTPDMKQDTLEGHQIMTNEPEVEMNNAITFVEI